MGGRTRVTMSEQAREDLMAMFRAYDRDGLSGDATDLERLLGRPAPRGASLWDEPPRGARASRPPLQ